MRGEYCALLLSALLFAGGASSLQAQTQTAAAAQPPDTVDLLDLSLEELLNITVTSTTKSSLEIRQAPGVVRVFTRTDIVRLGFTTLSDVLRQIPGIQVIEYRTGHQTIWVRGVQSRYNNKVLLLIDGVPMHDSFYGHFDIDESLRLDDAERIEIISGPGSVLYGTNAFAGVISITTRSPVPSGEPTLVSAAAEQGSFQSPRGSLNYSGHNLYARTSYLRTDGFSPVLNGDGRRVGTLAGRPLLFVVSQVRDPLVDVHRKLRRRCPCRPVQEVRPGPFLASAADCRGRLIQEGSSAESAFQGSRLLHLHWRC